MCAADLVLIFHIPLFTKWLKEVMSSGTRVLMVHDSPDDLDELMSPPGLKEAMKYADELYAQTKKICVTRDGGTELTFERGEYPVMSQWGYRTSRGISTFGGQGTSTPSPNEGSAHGTIVLRPGDIVRPFPDRRVIS